MLQFVLDGAQGSFQVPAGESRIGSDAACHICIRGEGVLPVHAYLRTEGEKLLIRPADTSTGSGSHTSAQIMVNGQPLTGPTNISGGQELALGGIQMRLRVLRPRMWTRAWFRRTLYVLGSIAALLLVAWLVLQYWYLDDARLKVVAKEFIDKHLHRESEAESIQVRFFKGEVEIKHLKIRDRYASSATFVVIDNVSVRLTPWLLLPLECKECTGLKIVLDSPKINIERSREDGTLNIKDIIQDMADRIGKSVTSDLGFTKFDATLIVKDGSIYLKDNFNSVIGDTSLENIEMTLRQPGAGEPLEITGCKAVERATPALPKDGKLALSGHINLVDSYCNIDLSKVSTNDLQLDAQDFDLARIFEHFGYSWEPYNTNFKVVLGKPLTGTLKLAANDPKCLHLSGKVSSESLISIKEPDHAPIGNIPTAAKFEVDLSDSGNGYSPEKINFELRSGPKPDEPSGTFLDFTASGGSTGGSSNYMMNIRCTLQDLLNTDVGRRLGLERYLGGHLSCTATLANENGVQKFDIRAGSDDSYVMVDTAKPGERPSLIRQSLPLNFSCQAGALPGANGRIAQVDIDKFNIKAPPSLVAESVVQGKVIGLDVPGKLAAQARFKLKLDGRKFWQHFAKILALLGFTRPIEEILDLNVAVVGQNDVIEAAASGTAERQWHPDPEPVKLDSVIDFDVGARQKQADGSTRPYLKVQLGVSSQEGKAMDVHLKAQCSRTENVETVRLEFYDIDNKQPDFADVSALRERFNPYIESYLHNYDSLSKSSAGVVEFYRDTVVTGALKPTGSISISHVMDPKSKDRDRVDFDLKVASKNFKIDLPFKTPPLPPAGKGADRWAWSEEHASLGLKGTFLQRLSENKEEPDYQRLELEGLDVEGSLGAFHVTARDLDLFKLANLKNFPNQTWTDVLAGMSMSGQVDPPAYDFLRSLGVIPADIPVSGTLALQIEYDRQKDSIDLQKFKFKQAREKNDFFLSGLDVTGALFHLRELSTKLLPVAEGAPPLTERFSALLNEGGPAALLDHLGENLTLDALKIETGPLRDWLCRDYAVAVPGRTPPAPIAAMIRGDWRPEGTWSAGALRLERDGDVKDRKWKLLGARLRNDLTVFGQSPKPGDARPVAAAFTHEWSLALGLALHNNTVAVSGDVILDDAYFFAALPQLKYDFLKPAKEPCTIQIGDLQYSHLPFPLAQIGSLTLAGKPFPIELKNFDGSYKAGQGFSLGIGSLALKGGPLPCAAVVRKLEPVSDQVDASFHMEKLDLPYLAKVLNLPGTISAEGTLNDVEAHYKGSLVALRHTFLPAGASPEEDIKPNDPRLSGMNPESDSLEVDSRLENVRFSANPSADRSTAVMLGGSLHLSTRDLAWKDFNAEIDYHVTGSPTVKQTVSIPRLAINSLDAKLNLARAVRAPGMPVGVNLPIVATTPLNVNALFGARQCFLSAAGTSIGDTEELKLSAFDQLAVSGSMKTPQLIVGASTFGDVEVPAEFIFKNLKLSQPLSTVALFGDKLALNDAEWDLSKAKIGYEHGALSIAGVEHRQSIKLSDGDLAAVLHTLPDKGFKISGRIGAEGNLSGSDFENEKRLTWNGGIKFAVTKLSIKMPPRQAAATANRYPLWCESFAPFGDRFCTAVAFAAAHDSVVAQDVNLEAPLSGPMKQLNGLIMGLQTYLSKCFGVELESLDFEPIKPTVVIRQGIAEIEPFQLVGRGESLGLDLHVETVKINLTDETFAGEVVIYPTSLPHSARERLLMGKWPAGLFVQFMNDVINGKIKLRCSGSIAAPTIKYPWTEVRVWGRRALFGVEKIEDLDTLDKGRKHFQHWWGPLPADVDTAAVLADRMGVGLPGTTTARTQGETIIERVTGLPQSLQKLLPIVGDPISPRESLRLLLSPPADPPQPKMPAPSNGEKK
jgi:hypothetical protein